MFAGVALTSISHFRTQKSIPHGVLFLYITYPTITGVDTWKEYLTKLTDDNFETSQWIQPMNAGNDFVIAYEFDAAMLEGFMLDAKGGASPELYIFSLAFITLLYNLKIWCVLRKISGAKRDKKVYNINAEKQLFFERFALIFLFSHFNWRKEVFCFKLSLKMCHRVKAT